MTLALFLAACEGDTIGPSPASGFFDPVSVDFGEVAAGRTSRVTADLRNTSGSRLVVRSVRFEPERDVFGAFLSAGGTLNGSALPNGRAVEVELRFGPRSAGVYDATMVMEADDLAVALPISARARDERPATPSLSPQSISFSGVAVDAVAQREVLVTNVGDQFGELTEVDVSGPGTFAVTAVGGDALILPVELEPGAGARFEIRYSPSAPDLEEEGVATFRFSSGLDAELSLSGRATAFGAPDCPGPLVDFGSVRRGQVVRRTIRCLLPSLPWTFEGANLRAGSAPYFSIVEAVAEPRDALEVIVEFEASGPLGQYLAVLELDGEPAADTQLTLTGTIAPPRLEDLSLSLELSWDTPFSDLDLHLVRSGGAPFVDGEDCYFAAKNPSWGDPNWLFDDPFLDRDDREGFGPERTTLLELGEPSYDVYVQYHDYRGAQSEPTRAEVVWSSRIGGSGRRTQDLAECGRFWHVGTLESGPPVRFVPVDTVSWAQRGRAAEKCR